MDGERKHPRRPLWQSFYFAGRGVLLHFRRERNAQIQLAFGAAACLLAALVGLSRCEWGLLILAIGGVLCAEAVNTAFELLIDAIHPEWDERIGEVKDVAAGAVLLAAITAAVLAILLFLPRILSTLTAWE